MQISDVSGEPRATHLYGHRDRYQSAWYYPARKGLGQRIRVQELKCTGIPVGVGIAGTKTLAKLASYTAKRLQAQTGGVVDICDPLKRDWVLRHTPVAEVWGAGRRMNARLGEMGINNAPDLTEADPWTLRKKFSVALEKTVGGLSGTPFLDLYWPVD